MNQVSNEIVSLLKTRNSNLHEIRMHLEKIGVHVNGKEISETCDALYKVGAIKVISFLCIDQPMSYQYNVVLKAASA